MSAVDVMMAGPRGRRMLLAYALEAEQLVNPEYHDESSFRSAVFLASYHLDPEPGVLFGPGADEARSTVIPPDEVARRLSEVPFPEVTASALRSALAGAVDMARYWQEPDGEDILGATESVRRELRRVAEHIARSPHAQWWTTGLVEDDQWLVGWGDDHLDAPETTVAEQLRDWHDRTLEWEARAARDRPADPTANWSGEWWSYPFVRCSTRSMFDGTPAGLWFVEDSMGWKRAVARRMSTPPGTRVYEIDGAQAWADLCRRFPVEVTAQKRHDWYRTTGRAGRWVVPDWLRVADEYEAVHLTVAGYLVAAGTAIEVDAETASVIAGWAPDETYWFTDAARCVGDPVVRLLDASREQPAWVEEAQQ